MIYDFLMMVTLKLSLLNILYLAVLLRILGRRLQNLWGESVDIVVMLLLKLSLVLAISGQILS
jgi:hypothetical protein